MLQIIIAVVAPSACIYSYNSYDNLEHIKVRSLLSISSIYVMETVEQVRRRITSLIAIFV